MKRLTNFENFDINETIVAAGFGMSGLNSWNLGGSTPRTGYDMTPIAGITNDTANHVATQATSYHNNDNENHTGENYIKEAKKHIGECIDKAYDGQSAGVTNEGKLNEAEYVIIDTRGNARDIGSKIQGQRFIKGKKGFHIVLKKNALKARRAIEKNGGKTTGAKISDTLYDMMYESVLNEGTDIGEWKGGGKDANKNVLITQFTGPAVLDKRVRSRKCIQVNVGMDYITLNANDIPNLINTLKNIRI
jgi:hypothetical protein